MNNTGVTGLTAQKDFEHAHGPRNSAYAVNLTYDRHTPTYRQHIYIYTSKEKKAFKINAKIEDVGLYED